MLLIMYGVLYSSIKTFLRTPFLASILICVALPTNRDRCWWGMGDLELGFVPAGPSFPERCGPAQPRLEVMQGMGTEPEGQLDLSALESTCKDLLIHYSWFRRHMQIPPSARARC